MIGILMQETTRAPRTYEEFMATARMKDPERVALIEHLYPVLADDELAQREAYEHEGDLAEAIAA